MWQDALKNSQCVAWGGLTFDVIEPMLTDSQRQGVDKLCPNPTGVLIAAFPYYCGDAPGNLSLYARGQDYHKVVVGRLEQVVKAMATDFPTAIFSVAVDNSPLPEVTLAAAAGLGLLGEHGLLIVPPYGSYVFLGTILTNAPLDFPPAQPIQPCLDCHKCQTACPTKAREGDSFHLDRCLSHVSQLKGVLTSAQELALKNHPLIWGCDFCQQACPYNQAVAHTQIPEFSETLLTDLTLEDLEGLSNRTFQEKYKDKAFTWRGPTPLKRNLSLK